MHCVSIDPKAMLPDDFNADVQARIAAVFRYLDPGGEGTVSLKAGLGRGLWWRDPIDPLHQEWSVLDQLWQEFAPWPKQKRIVD